MRIFASKAFNMTSYDKIKDKPYHFTLKRRDQNGIVPEAIISYDNNLHFSPEEMFELRCFYKKYGREVPFENFKEFSPNSYDEDYSVLLDNLYSCTSNIMKMIEKVYYPKPVLNRAHWVAMLEQELSYNLDDYIIVPPEELIDDVLDENFTDWVEIMVTLKNMSNIVYVQTLKLYPFL